jgi:hypothetical protein
MRNRVNDMNDFIYLGGKLFQFIDRKCSKIKQSSPPQRSLNGTMSVDILNTNDKTEWTFLFEIDQRNLNRLELIWSLNQEIVLKDWDNVEHSSVICTSNSFDPVFLGDQNGDYLFSISLDFKEG